VPIYGVTKGPKGGPILNTTLLYKGNIYGVGRNSKPYQFLNKSL